MRSLTNYDFTGVPDFGTNPSEYTIEVTLQDGWGRTLGEIGDYESVDLAFTSLADDVEASNITIPASSAWSRTLMRANRTLIRVSITIRRDGKRIKKWTGMVERCVRSMEHRQGKISVEMVSDKIFFRYINAWSAPFAPLWLQLPKKRLMLGRAIPTMKQFLIDNALRLQNRRPELNPILAAMSTYQHQPSLWGTIENYLWPLIVVPTDNRDDNSPIVALQARMTPIDALWSQVAKDYNLLPTISWYVPGEDETPPKITVSKPSLVVDILDKDKARAQKDPSLIVDIAKEAWVFIRGLFGRYDALPVVDLSQETELLKWFGQREDDAWPIFRTSEDNWFAYEVSSYAPTASTSIAGGKSQDFLNDGIKLVGNGLIRHSLALVGIGLKGNFIANELSDMLLAFQAAHDPSMRETLGPLTLFEEYLGEGTTAYSFDSAQALRLARHNAIGYKTATFQGDIVTVLPFRPFEDIDLLDPCAWEDPDEDRLVPERLKSISMSASASGVEWQFRLGEIERPEEPWAIQLRRNEMFKQAINTALLVD